MSANSIERECVMSATSIVGVELCCVVLCIVLYCIVYCIA